MGVPKKDGHAVATGPGLGGDGVARTAPADDAERHDADDDREGDQNASQAGVSANADGPPRLLGQDSSHQVQGCVSGWCAGIRSSGCSVPVTRGERAKNT